MFSLDELARSLEEDVIQSRLEYYQYKLRNKKFKSYVIDYVREPEWITAPISVIHTPVYSMYTETATKTRFQNYAEEMQESLGLELAYMDERTNSYVLKYHYICIKINLTYDEDAQMYAVSMSLHYDAMDKYKNTIDYLIFEELNAMYMQLCNLL